MIDDLSPSGQEIVKSICSHTNVSVEDVMSRDPEKSVVCARHICWFRLRDNGTQNSTIAKAFGVTPAAISRVYTRMGGTPALPINAWINEEHIGTYMAAADERGVQMVELIANLLKLIAKDDLFDAVLDDGK